MHTKTTVGEDRPYWTPLEQKRFYTNVEKIRIIFSQKRIHWELYHVLNIFLTAEEIIFKKIFLKVSIGPI
jgi:hypothetical protein